LTKTGFLYKLVFVGWQMLDHMIKKIQRIRNQMVAADNDPTQRYSLRPLQYESIDGANEISQGTMFLCLALASYLALPGTWLWQWRVGGYILLVIGGVLAPRYIPKAIKKHVTWPRTGYVAYRNAMKTSRLVVLFIVALIVSSIISLAVVHQIMPDIRAVASHSAINPPAISFNLKLLLGSFGLLSAPLYLMMTVGSIRKYPWKWFLLVLMVLGPIGITFRVPGDFLERIRPVILYLGLAWFASGAATLHSYLRHTQPPTPSAE